MILKEFGWTWEYLLWGIRYPTVTRMMADAPWYKFKKLDKNGKPAKDGTNIVMTNENAGDILKMLQSSQR